MGYETPRLSGRKTLTNTKSQNNRNRWLENTWMDVCGEAFFKSYRADWTHLGYMGGGLSGPLLARVTRLFLRRGPHACRSSELYLSNVSSKHHKHCIQGYREATHGRAETMRCLNSYAPGWTQQTLSPESILSLTEGLSCAF